MKYIFGPVFSRRLGFSLGVDLVPYKVCSMDCLYCESGKTTLKTCQRKEYVLVDDVKQELLEFFEFYEGKIDFITFSGYGEPTLNVKLGEMVNFIKENFLNIKIALITNSSLLFRKDVLSDIKDVDLILPSFDAASDNVFKKVNLPENSLSVEKIKEGLLKLKDSFKGEIWLETLFVKGINDCVEEVEKIGDFVKMLKPDRWQLNTVVRPPAYSGIEGLSYSELEQIRNLVNYPLTDILIRKEKKTNERKNFQNIEENIVKLVERRPSPIDEIVDAFGLTKVGLGKILINMQKAGKVEVREFKGEIFVFPKKKNI